MEQMKEKEIISQILLKTSLYIKRGQDEIKKMLDEKKQTDLSEAERERFNQIHVTIAILLDLALQTYPLCYDLFPEGKAALDEYRKMYDNFIEAGLIYPPKDYKAPDKPKEEPKE